MQADQTRRKGWIAAARILVCYAVLWAACVQLLFWYGNLFKLRACIESLVYPAVVLAVLAIPSVKTLWGRAGLVARCAAAGLLVLMINVQLLKKAHVTYPLCAWTMYASKTPLSLQFVDLAGVREDGVRIPVDTGELMPLSGLFMSRVGLVCEDAEKIRATQPDKAERMMATLDGLLAELERRYANDGGAVPLKRLEFVRVYIGKNGERLRDEAMRSSAAAPAQGGEQ